ncbi:MAG: hypothetical protein AAFX99_36625, partial [Myxococcota bacterium]
MQTHRTLWTALLMVWMALGSAPAAAQDPTSVALANLTPDTLAGRIEAAGWTVVSAPIETRNDGVTSWIWAVTRGTSGGAVGLYQYDATQQAQQLVELLGGKEDTAVTREGRVVVSVIATERPQDAQELMRNLLADPRRSKTSHRRPPLTTEHTVGTELARFSATSAEPLPELNLGDLTRAEVIHAVLQAGWTLAAPPETASGAGYRSVAYTLASAPADDGRAQGDRGQPTTALMTLYGCLTDRCVQQVTRAARPHRGALLRRGRTVLV